MTNNARPRNFQDILSRCTNPQKSGDSFTADCPVLGHKTPAGHLQLKDGGDKGLVRCYGPQQHPYVDICFALGFESLQYTNGQPKNPRKITDPEAMDKLKLAYGLTATTISHFGIEPLLLDQFWEYPVEGGKRYKSYARKGKRKYFHTKGTKNQLYGLTDIPQGTTEVVLANGEPAVWVLYQAGIPAVCGIYGEGILPKNTTDQLKAKGITSVLVIPDLDNAGKLAASKAFTTLSTELAVKVLELPDHLGNAGDLCDLFKWVGNDPAAFQKELQGLPELSIGLMKALTGPINNKYIAYDKNGAPSRLNEEILITDLLADFNFLTMRDTGAIRAYKGGVWATGGEEFIKEECQRRVGVSKFLTTAKLQEIQGHIVRSTYCDRKAFNRNTKVINIKNGLLVAATGQLVPHTHRFRSTVRIPIKYDPAAACPRVTQFFKEVMRPEDILIIEELFGYCLIPDYRFQRGFLLTGEGANGKSTLLSLFHAFIGANNCSHIPWQTLEIDRFAKAQLEGKLVNIFADLKSDKLTRTGTFKTLTGGDAIGSDRKYTKNWVSFTNFARLIFSANKPPAVVGEDSFAFWRRMIILNFDNRFVGTSDDKSLLGKLTTPPELSGLLNVALTGLQRLLAQDDFSYTKTADQSQEEYSQRTEPVYAFVRECCQLDPEDWVSKSDLYAAYRTYCQAAGLPLLKKDRFGQSLRNLADIDISVTHRRVHGTQVWCYEGIKLSDNEELDLGI